MFLCTHINDLLDPAKIGHTQEKIQLNFSEFKVGFKSGSGSKQTG